MYIHVHVHVYVLDRVTFLQISTMEIFYGSLKGLLSTLISKAGGIEPSPVYPPSIPETGWATQVDKENGWSLELYFKKHMNIIKHPVWILF